MKKRAVRTSSTENERDGLGTNMRLEKFVGLLRLPIWLSKLVVTAVYRDHGLRSLRQDKGVHSEARSDSTNRNNTGISQRSLVSRVVIPASEYEISLDSLDASLGL